MISSNAGSIGGFGNSNSETSDALQHGTWDIPRIENPMQISLCKINSKEIVATQTKLGWP